MDVIVGYEDGTPKLEVFREDLVWVVNGGFEAYDAAHKATYRIAATLIRPNIWRFVVPGTLAIGTYSGVVTDDSTDAFVAGKPIIVRSETSPIVPEDDLVTKLRLLAKDAQDSNFVPGEGPKAIGGGGPDSTNRVFRLQHQYIVPGSVYVTKGTDVRNGSGFSLDAANGILTFDSAPASSSSPFVVDYNFYWFPDAYYDEFLLNAGQDVGSADPDNVPDGLMPAMMQFALFHYYTARSSDAANKYGSSAMGVGQQVESVSNNFARLAKAAFERACTLRDDYYKGQGRQNQPASGVRTYRVDPGSPRR